MRSSQICKNDRENLHVILHLHLDSTNGWMRNADAEKQSLVRNAITKNMTSSLTPTAGGMIIKPFASPALGVFLLSIAKGQLVGWLVPQAQSKAREVPTSILTICHITWRRTNLAARHWHYLFTSQQCGFHVGTVWDGLSSLWIKNQHMRIVQVENTSRKANNTHFRL